MATDWSAWGKANASNLIGAASSIGGLYNSYQNSKIAEAEAKANRVFAGVEAASMERKATAIENSGVRAAQMEHYKGRVLHSDATAAMAAQGGVVDPAMLARIKQRSDYNAMSAMFDARSQAIDMRETAAMTRIQGQLDYSQGKARASDIYRSATYTAIGKFPRTWNQAPSKNPTHTGPPPGGWKSTVGR